LLCLSPPNQHGDTEGARRATERREEGNMLVHERITEAILGAAIEVHKYLGPGLLESAYEKCLCYEMERRGIKYGRQVPLAVIYKEFRLECGYWMDIVVEDAVVVELKSVEAILPVHEAQLMTYLRLSNKRVGLLINFGAATLKDGILRRVR
jgi:GxxExxY protein